VVERNFLITLDDSEVCDHLEFLGREPYCLRKSEYFKCNGDLTQRPELCPLSPTDDLLKKIKELEEHLDTFCKCPSHGPSLIHFNGVD